MGSTHQAILHDNLIEGADYTSPAHLIGHKWRVQHNMRLTPILKQIPHSVLYTTIGSDDIVEMVIAPSGTSGYGRTLLFTSTAVKNLGGTTLIGGLVGGGTHWSKLIYNGSLYFGNEYNSIRYWNGASTTLLSNSPKARYLCVWYDHLVAAGILNSPSTLACSDLYNFNVWTPTATNEADTYDFVEWQQTDYPFIGITGIGKLGGTLWVYTPTALIPVRYVGLPKVLHVVEDQIIARAGNTFPYTLVCLDKVHFFYDGIEKMFFAFNGQEVLAVGEPVRAYLINNLSTNLALASKMFGFIDVDNREIWWVFVSTASTGAFDKAVVFNYRYKRWFTASVNDVKCFCGGTNPILAAKELTGAAKDLTGTAGSLGLGGTYVPRLYGSSAGQVLREEVVADSTGTLLAQDTIALESADFHYGDIKTIKENDSMFLNASFTSNEGTVVVTSYVVATAPDTGYDVTFDVIVGVPYKWVPVSGDSHLHNGNSVLLASDGTQTFLALSTTVVVNTSHTTATLKNEGAIKVLSQGRMFLGGDVTWTADDLCGYWSSYVQDDKFTYAPRVGRILRYRFEGESLRFLTFSAYSDGVRAKGAEK